MILSQNILICLTLSTRELLYSLVRLSLSFIGKASYHSIEILSPKLWIARECISCIQRWWPLYIIIYGTSAYYAWTYKYIIFRMIRQHFKSYYSNCLSSTLMQVRHLIFINCLPPQKILSICFYYHTFYFWTTCIYREWDVLEKRKK